MLTLSTIALSVGAHYIPSSSLEHLGIHPINILSDIGVGNTTRALDNLDGEYGADLTPEETGTGNMVASDTTSTTDSTSQKPDFRVLGSSANPIVDYAQGGNSLESLFAKMRDIDTLGRPLRIGVLGDSFIEGDILTSDLREKLQDRLGGGGVGFVPITSQTAAFRTTVAHTFKGWTSRSIINTKANNFLITGQVSTTAPGGSYVHYRSGRGKKFIDKFGQATLVFTSTAPTTITITVNDTTIQDYVTTTSPKLQKIVTQGQIHSIKYEMDSTEGFTAYGAMLENRSGVSLDNLSVRSHSGTALSKLSPTLNRQFAQMANYDLLVLQYGLNVVRSSVVNYVYYQKQMIDVIARIKECYPDTPILLLSVSDRGTRLENSQWETMPGIVAMVETQKRIASQSGVAFWNTYAMMQSLGGISKFVTNGWAAKDYTHIGVKGGEKVAKALFDALMSAKEESDIAAKNRKQYIEAAAKAQAKYEADSISSPICPKPTSLDTTHQRSRSRR